jgi:hypothetical protein
VGLWGRGAKCSYCVPCDWAFRLGGGGLGPIAGQRGSRQEKQGAKWVLVSRARPGDWDRWGRLLDEMDAPSVEPKRVVLTLKTTGAIRRGQPGEHGGILGGDGSICGAAIGHGQR